MKCPKLAIALVAILVAALASSADAGIVSTGTGINVIATPSAGTYTKDTNNNSTQLSLWYEGQVTVNGTTTLQHHGPGTVDQVFFNPFTPAAQQVQSYYLLFDPAGTSSVVLTSNMTITFSDPIIGVYVNTAGLNASDTFFAPAGVTYSLTADRGFDPRNIPVFESFTISPDLYSITINSLRAGLDPGDVVDSLRIITNPEPTSFALFGLGLLAVLGMQRRKAVGAVSSTR